MRKISGRRRTYFTRYFHFKRQLFCVYPSNSDDHLLLLLPPPPAPAPPLCRSSPKLLHSHTNNFNFKLSHHANLFLNSPLSSCCCVCVKYLVARNVTNCDLNILLVTLSFWLAISLNSKAALTCWRWRERECQTSPLKCSYKLVDSNGGLNVCSRLAASGGKKARN